MDVEESNRILFTRVQGFDAENALKIMGYLLLQDWREQDLLGLALSSDVMLHSLVVKVKRELGLNPRTIPMLSGQLPSQLQAEINKPLAHQASAHSTIPGSLTGIRSSFNDSFFETEKPKFGFGKFCPYPAIPQVDNRWASPQRSSRQDKSAVSREEQEEAIASSNWSSYSPLHVDASSTHLNTLPTWKPCLFYSRGYCKHGSNCRFLHSGVRDFSSRVLPVTQDFSDATGSDDGIMASGSIGCLEQELKELLIERRTPVSIASLPQLYYEKFGKSIQAEGYLTESQRHGKSGYSLTKLLMRLKGISLIDRPHGQHAVILNDNAHKLTDFRVDQDDSSPTNSSSRQIYLTFPADSTFTEDDVTIHFSAYGPVKDVRIPHQQRRMFGFVTFLYADTVKTILADGNPHYICGARVLVKPYKEKGKVGDRKLSERNQSRQIQTISRQTASNQLEDGPFSYNAEDETFRPLDKGIVEPRGSRVRTTVSQATPVASVGCWQQRQSSTSDVDVECTTAGADDDCLDFQLSALGHVLDILDMETKDADSPKYSSVETDATLDSCTSDCSFENPLISETKANTQDKISVENPCYQQTFATTVEKLKSHHFSAQSIPLGQCSWSSPTPLARSVF